jgi:hypothetical protein
MRYEGPRQEPPGRIPVIWIAEFVELTIWGRDLEWEEQAAIVAQAGAAASGGAGSSGHAAPRVTAAAQGGEEHAAVKARAKAINDLSWEPGGAGSAGASRPPYPTNRRADHQTLALEVATLYVVNALGVRAPGGSKEPEEADKELEVPAEGMEKGKGKEKEECKGLPHLGNLTWAKQREKWKQEGLDSRQIRRLAA